MANPAIVINPSIFDLEKAAKRLGGQTELLQKFALLFLRDAPGQLNQMNIGIEMQDYDLCFVAAHTLKGTSAVFCNTEFECHCSEVVDCIRQKEWSKAASLMVQINQEYVEFQQQLKTFVMSYKLK